MVLWWFTECVHSPVHLSLQAAHERTDAYLVDLDYIGEPRVHTSQDLSHSFSLPSCEYSCAKCLKRCTVQQKISMAGNVCEFHR